MLPDDIVYCSENVNEITRTFFFCKHCTTEVNFDVERGSEAGCLRSVTCRFLKGRRRRLGKYPIDVYGGGKGDTTCTLTSHLSHSSRSESLTK